VTQAYFTSSSYEAGETAQFCWDVSSNNVAYSYTTTVVNPNAGALTNGSGQFGGGCALYAIPEQFSGTLEMRVDVSTPGTSTASATVQVHAPPAELTHISVTLDQTFYAVGQTAVVCWNASDTGASYTWEAYLQTFLEESGNGIGGTQICRQFAVTEQHYYDGGILVEVYAFQGNIQVYGSAHAEVDFEG
jgi:hypothetical protein